MPTSAPWELLQWSADDRAFAHMVQTQNDRPALPLADQVDPLSTSENRNGPGRGSDDIGDVMWTVPIITIRYPSNIPGLLSHNCMSAMAMATPISHKGATAGAKAVAMTIIDLLMKPSLIAQAKAYFTDVQTRDQTYDPVLSASDQPPIQTNAKIMRELEPVMARTHYDPKRYDTYLQQLGIDYPSGRISPKSRSQTKGRSHP